jgi:hypothetical protein
MQASSLSGTDASETPRWYVMRDLKRANARQHAYQLFQEQQMEVFTPMKWQLSTVKGKHVRREVPYMADLLFVHDTRQHIDPLVESHPTIQYRWLRNKFREPMTVSDAEMTRFIQAVRSTESPRYYLPEEITPSMLGRAIRMVGGTLDGYEGTLLTTRGSRVKRLLVELPGLLTVGVEVNPDYIQFV